MTTEAKPQRWKCVCAYDGTDFSGWQSQAGGKSVQDTIEARLAIVAGAPLRIHGSGRTDAGVHARAQVFHFELAWKHGEERLAAALRSELPQSLQIKSVKRAKPAFHARFAAKGKVYTYDLYIGDADPFTRPYVWSVYRPLDLSAIKAAASLLCGRHDFKAFAASRGDGSDTDTVRHLRRLEVVRRGHRIRITAEGDGFLYKMVRSLVGTLVAVGEGRLPVCAVGEILASKKRTEKVHTAPAQGLFLDKVLYR